MAQTEMLKNSIFDICAGDLVTTSATVWSLYSRICDARRLGGDYTVLPGGTILMVIEVRPHGSQYLSDVVSFARVFVPGSGEYWTSTAKMIAA